jgi:hypothetical protein
MSVLLSYPIFGKATDGANLSISSNTTDTPIVAFVSAGAAGSYQFTSQTAYSFAAGQLVFLHQSRATGFGACELVYLTGYNSGTGVCTTATPLRNTYNAGAQAYVVKQYGNGTINSCTWTSPGWNGTSAGIHGFAFNGVLTLNSATISTQALGFRGAGAVSNTDGYQGESYLSGGVQSNTANNNSGGGGWDGANHSGGFGGGGGGGGANVANGGAGGSGGSTGGGGAASVFGGSGGSGGAMYSGSNSGAGGNGGGIILIIARKIVINSSNINAIGANGLNGTAGDAGGGGGGAGGSILIITENINTMSGVIAYGGNGGGYFGSGANGGVGSNGRIALMACNPGVNNSNPAYNNNGYQSYCGVVGRG